MIAKEKSDFVISLAEGNGYISPERVIEAARDPTSPIHTDFTWDVREAAREHWLDQARTLIRFVKLNVQISNRSVIAPYYVPDPQRPTHSKRYIELTVAGRNDDVARQVLVAELDRIAAAIRRAQQIADVLGLSDQLDELLDNVTNLKTAAERRQLEKEAQRAAKVPPRKRKPRGGGHSARL
jgi:uncharacterized protein YecE (DUF72 family)